MEEFSSRYLLFLSWVGRRWWSSFPWSVSLSRVRSYPICVAKPSPHRGSHERGSLFLGSPCPGAPPRSHPDRFPVVEILETKGKETFKRRVLNVTSSCASFRPAESVASPTSQPRVPVFVAESFGNCSGRTSASM